ncbi:protein SYM1, partial [Violaceomyces palustris]
MSRIRSLLNATTSTFPRKCLTTSVLFATGDTISQRIFEGNARSGGGSGGGVGSTRGKSGFGGGGQDYLRSLRMAFHGGVIYAPIMTTWLSLIGGIKMQSKVLQTVVRVAMDQIIIGPILPAVFFTSLTLLEGGDLKKVSEKLSKAWFDTWLVGVAVFTPASVINMTLIAPQNRILFVNAVGLSWNTFLSYKNSRTKSLIEH